MKKLIITLLLIFVFVPAYKISVAAPTVEKKTVTDALGTKSIDLAETVSNNAFFKKTTEWVVARTPSFIKTAFSRSITVLEKFRAGAFDSKYIFYPIIFIFLYFLIRFVWDFFFY